MGYILKLKIEDKTIVKLFYSKPERGYYANTWMAVSRKEYDEYYSKVSTNFVFMENWCDATAEVFSAEALGIDITDSFFLDCILQGKEIPYNEPIEFEINL